MIVAQEVVDKARAFLGVRFMHQGRTSQGLDCLGLLLLTASELGLRWESKEPFSLALPNYSLRPDTQVLQAYLARYLVAVSAVSLADVVLLEVDGSPQHLAIVTDYPAAQGWGMIHAYAPARKVVEHRYDEQWQRATRMTYRLPQLVA